MPDQKLTRSQVDCHVAPRGFTSYRRSLTLTMANWLIIVCLINYSNTTNVLATTRDSGFSEQTPISRDSSFSRLPTSTAYYQDSPPIQIKSSTDAGIEPTTTVEQPAASTSTPFMRENDYYQMDLELFNTRIVQVLGLLSLCFVAPYAWQYVFPWVVTLAKSFLMKLCGAAATASFLIAVFYSLRKPAKLILYRYIPNTFNSAAQTGADVLALPLLVVACTFFLTLCVHVCLYRSFFYLQGKKLVQLIGFTGERLFKGRLTVFIDF